MPRTKRESLVSFGIALATKWLPREIIPAAVNRTGEENVRVIGAVYVVFVRAHVYVPRTAPLYKGVAAPAVCIKGFPEDKKQNEKETGRRKEEEEEGTDDECPYNKAGGGTWRSSIYVYAYSRTLDCSVAQ